MMRLLLLVMGMVGAMSSPAAEDYSVWEDSIVVIESNSVDFSYYEPWSASSQTISKNGVVVDGKRILTTADWMQNSTHVRAQKNGRGSWWNAHIEWVDYHANLAVLGVDDDAFWQGLTGVPFTREIPRHGHVQLFRQASGNLESWQAAVSKIFVASSQRSFVRHMMLELTSDVDSSGWSEVVVRNGDVVGLAASQDGDRLLVIPAPVILDVMAAKEHDPSASLAYFDFVWQLTRNAALTDYLELEGPSRGVVVTKVRADSAFAGILEHRDIVIEIDGFTIDSDGDYEDPMYGHLSFRNLATRDRVAGDRSVFKVWRDGGYLDLEVVLPAARYDDELVPDYVFDRSPEYMIVGGLIFQPLTTSYLRSWGKEWWKSAPYRMTYYTYEKATPERPQLVILSHLLPDRFNLGYQELAYMALDKVNGRTISSIRSLADALKHPRDGFHVFEFFPNNNTGKLVLDATALEQATSRITANYGIPRSAVIH